MALDWERINWGGGFQVLIGGWYLGLGGGGGGLAYMN